VQEKKTGDQQRIRSLFARVTHLDLPLEKMKKLFRRYMDYEETEGDAAGVQRVRQAMIEFGEAHGLTGA